MRDRATAGPPLRVIAISLILVLGGFLVSACGGSPARTPNPASVFCEQKGGKVDLKTGICSLPDGTKVDEWEYYRTQTGGSVGIANPASVFCEQKNGVVDLQTSICSLPDGTKVDEWAYYRSQTSNAGG